MEQDTGRRRSSRLAARGVTTPKAEVVVKKTYKSSEKPKRSKRKINEEINELTVAKKTKTEDKTTDEIEKPKETKTNDIVIKEVSVVIEMNVDNVEADVLPIKEEENDKPTVEEKPVIIIPTESCKQKVDIDEKEKIDIPLAINDENQTEATEELIKINEPENTDEEKIDVSQDETKDEETGSLENINGKNDDEEIVEEKNIKNDIGLCVTKDTVTPNGDSDNQVKTANGDDTPVTKTETTEPIKVLQDDTNHVIETDVKEVTIPTIAITTASNNDTPNVEQVEKELDKVINNVVDNMSVTVENNTPNVDQSSTVAS